MKKISEYLNIAEVKLENKYYIWLFLPFLFLLIAQYFIPNHPIKDEKLFYPLIIKFGSNYSGMFDQIKYFTLPMTPLYFIIYGFLGKLTGFSLLLLRSINVLCAYICTLYVYKIFRHYTRIPILLTFLFIINPYFIFLTVPLLYTDTIGYLFLFAGTYYYALGQNRLKAAIWWTLAIYVRQINVIVPAA